MSLCGGMIVRPILGRSVRSGTERESGHLLVFRLVAHEDHLTSSQEYFPVALILFVDFSRLVTAIDAGVDDAATHFDDRSGTTGRRQKQRL